MHADNIHRSFDHNSLILDISLSNKRTNVSESRSDFLDSFGMFWTMGMDIILSSSCSYSANDIHNYTHEIFIFCNILTSPQDRCYILDRTNNSVIFPSEFGVVKVVLIMHSLSLPPSLIFIAQAITEKYCFCSSWNAKIRWFAHLYWEIMPLKETF